MNSYTMQVTRRFEKDLQLCKKRGFNLNLLYAVIEELKSTGTLPARYRPHKLNGSYAGYWECHLKSDWLLIWEQRDDELILVFMATGTHADLF